MTIKDFLNDIEKSELEKLVASPILMEALKKVLCYDIYYSGVIQKDLPADPQRNFALGLVVGREGVSNDVIGQDLRACAEGVRLLEGGFRRLGEFKRSEENKEENKNEAR